MHDDDFTRSEKLLGYDDAAQSVGYPTPCITDDMGVAFFKA